jgi:hypothetical protein
LDVIILIIILVRNVSWAVDKETPMVAQFPQISSGKVACKVIGAQQGPAKKV